VAVSGWGRRLALTVLAIGVVLLFIAAGQLLIDHAMTPGIAYSLIGGIALLLLGFVIDPGAALDPVRSRRTRFGSVSVLVSAGVIGALVMGNVIASRSLAAVDLTRAGYYTLSGRSVAALKRIDSPLVVTGFYRNSADEIRARHDDETLLALYQARSGFFTVRMVDPDANFELAKRLGVTSTGSGSLALQYKGKPAIVLAHGSHTEQDLTSAILKLQSDRTPQICWVVGDGERDLKDSDEADGYSAVRAQLDLNNYRTLSLPLATVGAVPPDCDVLAILGPRRALSAGVAQSVADYLNRGGKLLLAADPYLDQSNTSLNSLLKPYGVGFDGGLVIDADDSHHALNDLTAPVVLDFGPSPVARGMSGNLAFFSRATAIVGQPDASVSAVKVATTTANSYEIAQPRDRNDRRSGDKAGPFTLVETLEKRQEGGKSTRVVISGTGRIGSNLVLPPLQSGTGNLQLVLSSLDWLTQQEDLISLPPKPARAVPLSISDADRNFSLLVTVGLLPLAVAAAGLLVWYRRRRVLPS
jgi:ABC-2 type transport system permease protein